MKEKPYVKVAMYALNIIFAIIIIVPVVYCFNDGSERDLRRKVLAVSSDP